MENILLISIIFLSGTTGVAIGAVFGVALTRRPAIVAG